MAKQPALGATRAMSRETAITNTIMKHLRLIEGLWAMKLHGSAYQTAGVPDILVIYRGEPWFFEVKQPGEKPSPIQEHIMRKLREAGARARVVHSWAEVEEQLRAVAGPFWG